MCHGINIKGGGGLLFRKYISHIPFNEQEEVFIKKIYIHFNEQEYFRLIKQFASEKKIRKKCQEFSSQILNL